MLLPDARKTYPSKNAEKSPSLVRKKVHSVVWPELGQPPPIAFVMHSNGQYTQFHHRILHLLCMVGLLWPKSFALLGDYVLVANPIEQIQQMIIV